MTPTEILTKLYDLEEPFKIEARFDKGFNFCYGEERRDEYGNIIFKQSLQTYNAQDGFDWFEGILKKG